MEDTNNKQNKAIAILETNYIFMTQQLKEIKEGINEIKSEINCIRLESKKDFEAHIKDSDERYASKKTEIAVERIGWVIVLGVVGALLTLVVK